MPSRVRACALAVAIVALLLPPVGVAAQSPSGGEAVKGATWGAPSGTPEQAFTRSGTITPATRADIVGDTPPYYADGCHVTPSGHSPIGCVYGDPRGTDVAMVGDSKIGQWFPALEEIAHREGWRLRVYTKSSCSYLPDYTYPGYAACDTYNDRLQTVLRDDPPALLIVSGRRRDVVDHYVTAWRDLRQRGVERIAALDDSPQPSLLAGECLEPLVPAGDYLESCAWTTDGVSGSSTLRAATGRVDGAEFVDMGDWVCPPSTLSPACPAVIGGAVVYAGATHLTATYVATLTDALHEQLYRAGVAAEPPEPERVERLGGRTRYDTAALLGSSASQGRPVFVASGQDFPDALTAAAAAGQDGGPVLLAEVDRIPAATRTALTALAPSSITVVGGDAAVDETVLDALGAYTAGTVSRVRGANRYGTAAAVARTVGTAVDMVYVANGQNFPDALTAASRAGHEGAPVLLTRAGELPPETAEALADLAPAAVTVMGGSAAVTDDVVTRVRALTQAPVTRLFGTDRYGTAAAVADLYATPAPQVYVASGANFPDALAAAARAGAEGAPVLLVRPDAIPPATAAALARLRPQQIVVVGASGAVSDRVRWGLERYLG